MAIVLEASLTLNPGNQIAYLADDTGLIVGTEYVIAGTYLAADTRFTYNGNLDIVLTKQPIAVPANNYVTPVSVNTVPTAAPAPPVATYPYLLKNQLSASNLNNDLEFSPGLLPPQSALGGAGKFKYWVDTSTTLPTLRQCLVPRASTSYVAADWLTLGTIDAANHKFNFDGTNVFFTTFSITGSLTVGTTGYFGGDVTIHGANVGLNVDNGGINVAGTSNFSQGINAANLTLSGGGPAVLTVTNGGITVAGGSIFPSLVLNGGGAAVLNVTNGGINVAGGSTFPNLVLNGGGTSVLNVPNGGIYVAGDTAFGASLSVSGIGYFGGDVTIAGPGYGLTISNGGVNVAGNSAFNQGVTVATTVTTANVSASGAVAVQGTLNVAGGTQLAGVNAANLTLSGGGGAVLNVPSGGINVAGGSTFPNLVLTGGGTTVLNVPGGGITVAGDSFFQTLTLNGGGNAVLNVPGGGITSGSIVLTTNNALKPGGGMWSDNSDARTKRSVAPYLSGLDVVTRLDPVSFQHNGVGGSVDDGATYVGLIADAVEGVMPEMVGKRKADDGEEYLTLDATALIYALVNAVKELNTKVVTLEAVRA
jgi:hypothetical protein